MLHSPHFHESAYFGGKLNSFQDHSLVINFVDCQKHWETHLSYLRKVCYLYLMVLYHSLVKYTVNYWDLTLICQTIKFNFL